eukprot:265028-Chlamydomonas_euryale.AAC.1
MSPTGKARCDPHVRAEQPSGWRIGLRMHVSRDGQVEERTSTGVGWFEREGPAVATSNAAPSVRACQRAAPLAALQLATQLGHTVRKKSPAVAGVLARRPGIMPGAPRRRPQAWCPRAMPTVEHCREATLAARSSTGHRAEQPAKLDKACSAAPAAGIR